MALDRARSAAPPCLAGDPFLELAPEPSDRDDEPHHDLSRERWLLPRAVCHENEHTGATRPVDDGHADLAQRMGKATPSKGSNDLTEEPQRDVCSQPEGNPNLHQVGEGPEAHAPTTTSLVDVGADDPLVPWHQHASRRRLTPVNRITSSKLKARSIEPTRARCRPHPGATAHGARSSRKRPGLHEGSHATSPPPGAVPLSCHNGWHVAVNPGSCR